MKPLARSFFKRDAVLCARELIGCTLGLAGTSGVIVETEAYAAEGDPACHTWNRQGARDFVSRNDPGTSYVYLNYGMHWLFNLLVKGGERDGFVLIRALEPLGGVDLMKERRRRGVVEELCNGPAKLTRALGITGDHHEVDPLSVRGWVLAKPEKTVATITSRRIGISQATEYPWRFYMKGNRCVSFPV